ncbi:hypothetical protein OH77DRAFT_1365392, partial [Trametes cingulata]
EPWLLAGLMMSAVLHALAAASRPHLRYVLATLQAMVYGLFMYSNRTSGGPATLNPTQSSLFSSIPSDVRTVLADLRLEPDIVRFASC